MLQASVLVFLLCCSVVQTEVKLNALRYGENDLDCIEWSPVDLSSASKQFSVCTWLRNRHSSYNPVVLFYDSISDYDSNDPADDINGLILGSNGYWNRVLGRDKMLLAKFNIPVNKWFHICWTWSAQDRFTARVFLNGELIGSRDYTTGRYLGTGGRMRLGNWDSKFLNSTIFNGDMFKLNIYNRALSLSEIEIMSSDICSFTENRLTSSRIVRWEDIISKDRTGDVTDIPTDCYENENDSLRALIEDNGRYLTVTIVFSVLSTTLLIILIILARKLVAVSVNRTKQPVPMATLVTNKQGQEEGEAEDDNFQPVNYED